MGVSKKQFLEGGTSPAMTEEAALDSVELSFNAKNEVSAKVKCYDMKTGDASERAAKIFDALRLKYKDN